MLIVLKINNNNKNFENAQDALWYCVKHQHTEHIAHLIEYYNADPNQHDKNEEDHTPLSYAADQGYTDVVTLILSLVKSSNHINLIFNQNIGQTILNLAKRNNLTIAQQLFSIAKTKGKTINLERWVSNDKTALRIVVEKRHIDFIRLLMQHRADANAISKNDNKSPLSYAVSQENNEAVTVICSFPNFTVDKNTAELILEATRKNNLVIVKQIFDAARGQKINLEDAKFEGKTALRIAVEQEKPNAELVELLIKNGADANAGFVENKHNTTTPFSYAIARDYTDIIAVMHDHKYFKVCKDTGRAILEAAIKNNFAAAKQIFFTAKITDQTINFIMWNFLGKTSLHIVTEHKNIPFILFLIEHGADPNAISTVDKQSPLFYAVSQNDTDVAIAICTARNFVANEKLCELVLEAAKKNNILIARQLLAASKGGKINLEEWTNNGKTALRFAVEHNNEEFIMLLMSYGADPRAISETDQESPLSYAVNNLPDAATAIYHSPSFTIPKEKIKNNSDTKKSITPMRNNQHNSTAGNNTTAKTSTMVQFTL